MGLKDRKYICNTGKLPGFVDGVEAPQPGTANASNVGINKNTGTSSAAAGAGPFFAIGSWLGEGVLSGLAAANKSVDEHLMDAGTSQANINGIGYTKQNNVDVAGIMGDYDKEAGTAWLTNPGKAITMLFGRSAAKRAAENAAIHADIMQGAARDNAYTQYLRLDNAKRYGNTNDQQMYAAKDGKLPKFVGGKPTYSVLGETNAKPNAKLSGGEIVYNMGLGKASEVGGPENNRDQEYGYLHASDGVLSNKPGLFGYSPADLFRATGNLKAAENYMIASNNMKGNRMYKNGRLPRFSTGWASNFIPSAVGTAMSLEQMYQAYMNKPKKPDTYVANPYENEALTTLAGLRVNPYPIMGQLRSAEARTNRAVDIAGGLSGAQRAYSRLGALNTTQNNIANLLMNAQLQDNQYKTNYAQQALNAGNATRTARMTANQYDLDYFSKAHAARQKGMQTGAANLLEQLQQYTANEFKRDQFDRMYGLYAADMCERKKAQDWQRWYTLNRKSLEG